MDLLTPDVSLLTERRFPPPNDQNARSQMRSTSTQRSEEIVDNPAIIAAVFAGAAGYASAQAFSDGFGAAMGVAAARSLAGAIAGLALPGRPEPEVAPPHAVPALEAEGER
jgi:hypothetical protein